MNREHLKVAAISLAAVLLLIYWIFGGQPENLEEYSEKYLTKGHETEAEIKYWIDLIYDASDTAIHTSRSDEIEFQAAMLYLRDSTECMIRAAKRNPRVDADLLERFAIIEIFGESVVNNYRNYIATGIVGEVPHLTENDCVSIYHEKTSYLDYPTIRNLGALLKLNLGEYSKYIIEHKVAPDTPYTESYGYWLHEHERSYILADKLLSNKISEDRLGGILIRYQISRHCLRNGVSLDSSLGNSLLSSFEEIAKQSLHLISDLRFYYRVNRIEFSGMRIPESHECEDLERKILSYSDFFRRDD